MSFSTDNVSFPTVSSFPTGYCVWVCKRKSFSFCMQNLRAVLEAESEPENLLDAKNSSPAITRAPRAAGISIKDLMKDHLTYA